MGRKGYGLAARTVRTVHVQEREIAPVIVKGYARVSHFLERGENAGRHIPAAD